MYVFDFVVRDREPEDRSNILEEFRHSERESRQVVDDKNVW